MARLGYHLNECSEQDGNISVSGIQLWYSPQYRCASPCLSLRNPMQTQLSQMGSRLVTGVVLIVCFLSSGTLACCCMILHYIYSKGFHSCKPDISH